MKMCAYMTNNIDQRRDVEACPFLLGALASFCVFWTFFTSGFASALSNSSANVSFCRAVCLLCGLSSSSASLSTTLTTRRLVGGEGVLVARVNKSLGGQVSSTSYSGSSRGNCDLARAPGGGLKKGFGNSAFIPRLMTSVSNGRLFAQIS
jgi:Na+/melibiose symporter-like transporter